MSMSHLSALVGEWMAGKSPCFVGKSEETAGETRGLEEARFGAMARSGYGNFLLGIIKGAIFPKRIEYFY